MYVRVSKGGSGSIGPPIQKYNGGGGAKYVLPPHEMCYNKCYIYIKFSILFLLVHIFANEFYLK